MRLAFKADLIRDHWTCITYRHAVVIVGQEHDTW